MTRVEDRTRDRDGDRGRDRTPQSRETPQPGVTVSDLPRDPVPPQTASANDAAAPGESDANVQLFINVGRREGVRGPDLEKFLRERGVVVDEATGIRVRDRMTFILVKKEHFDRAIAALSGQTIGGRTVVAELARARA